MKLRKGRIYVDHCCIGEQDSCFYKPIERRKGYWIAASWPQNSPVAYYANIGDDDHEGLAQATTLDAALLGLTWEQLRSELTKLPKD